jgi:hypothetical protein
MYLSYLGNIREEYDSTTIATLQRKGWVEVLSNNSGLQWFIHTDLRFAIVSGHDDVSITLEIYQTKGSKRLGEPPITTTVIESVLPDYEDANNEAATALGAGWTRYKDGVVYAGDLAKPRTVPAVAQRWALRVAFTTAQLTAINSYINGLSNPKKGYYTEFWAGSDMIKRQSRFIKDLITAGVTTAGGMNTVFINALNITVKSL